MRCTCGCELVAYCTKCGGYLPLAKRAKEPKKYGRKRIKNKTIFNQLQNSQTAPSAHLNSSTNARR